MSEFTKLIRRTVFTAVFALMAFIPPTGGTQKACAATYDPCETIRLAALEACLGALETYFDVGRRRGNRGGIPVRQRDVHGPVQRVEEALQEGLTGVWQSPATSAAVALCLLTVPCAGQQAGATRIEVNFTEAFWIGDEESGWHFADIRAMHFTADGQRLVVLDGRAYTITVFDMSGVAIASWGGQGQGPGEFRRPPRHFAVSAGGHVAVSNSGRADVFDVNGGLVETIPYDELSVLGLMYDRQGRLLAETGSPFETSPLELVRLEDREVIWTSKPIPAGITRTRYSTLPVIDAIGASRVVVGHTDRYDLAILDSSTGEQVGRIARDVQIRTVTDGHKRRVINRLGKVAEEAGRPAATVADTEFGENFPLAVKTYAGPGGMLWVRRHMGVGDQLAPRIEDMEGAILRLYDLFSSTGTYRGTVEVPEGFLLMAGSAEFVAGIHRDDLDRESVRVLRVRVPQG